MIDIHCHILPGVDDGPDRVEESIDMAEMAFRDGITHIVATPHVRYTKEPPGGKIGEARENLRLRLREKGVGVELLGGADLRLTYELLDGMEKGDVPTINGTRYFLLELPELLPPGLDRIFQAAKMHGYVPVITHPERNYTLLSSPEKIGILKEGGCLFQFTAMSFTGGFGDRVRSLSHLLLRRGFVDFVASDAHRATGRVPMLSAAKAELSRVVDAAKVRRIFFDNPLTLVENREIPGE